MKIIVSLSGGLDSCVLLSEIINQDKKVRAVGFIYGSCHNKYEIKASENIAKHFKIPIEFIDVSNIFNKFKSALLLQNNVPIPEGHYKSENMRVTVVPGRNLIFASILAGYAESIKYDTIMLGIHAGDHFIYPDCRPEFVSVLNETVKTSTNGLVSIKAPFTSWNKSDIIKAGTNNSVPFELTRTCYKNQSIACGKCGSCNERLEAFKNCGIEDPIEYKK